MQREEDLFPTEYEKRKKSMRADALVIPEDVLRAMRVPKDKDTGEWAEEYKDKAQECIDRAKSDLYPEEHVESVPLALHQYVADSVVVLACVYYHTTDSKRIHLLSEIIRHSQISARTNYQFIRHYIRRNIAPILEELGIEVPGEWGTSLCKALNSEAPLLHDTHPERHAKQETVEVPFGTRLKKAAMDGSLKGIEKGFEGLTKWSVTAGPLLAASALYALWEMHPQIYRLVGDFLGIGKGEFEHYDEIKEVLAKIEVVDPNGKRLDIRVLKGRDQGWDYVSTGLNLRGIRCVAWDPESPKVRYYVFPRSHLLLLALGEGQFIAFAGGDPRAVAASKQLFEYDAEIAGEEPKGR